MNTQPLHALFGLPGLPMTSTECRALRSALNLERRNIVTLANALAPEGPLIEMTTIAASEKARSSGYSPRLALALVDLEIAISRWADELIFNSLPEGERVRVLLKPIGEEKIRAAILKHHRDPSTFTADVVAALTERNGEFWANLADAAIVRAGIEIRRVGFHARVGIAN